MPAPSRASQALPGRGQARGPRVLTVLALVPLLAGAKGEGGGCGLFATDPAPDMSGDWSVAYDDQLTVEVTIGAGAARKTHNFTLDAAGGSFEVPLNAEGDQSVTFDLNCEDPAVLCPSELWPAAVSFRQDHPRYTHRVFLQVPKQRCDGELVPADPDTCGDDINPDCEDVCMGETVLETKEAFGTINESEDEFALLLGGGMASSGLNCALLGLSAAKGELVTSGEAESEGWRVESIEAGEVVVAYAGGCLWAQSSGDPMDPEVQGVVLGASIRLNSGYTAARAE